MEWILNKVYYRVVYIIVSIVSAMIAMIPGFVVMAVPENLAWIGYVLIFPCIMQIFFVFGPVLGVLSTYRNACSKRGLIHEADIYKLFEQNGTANLHVADIDQLPRYNVEYPQTKFFVRERAIPLVCEIGDQSVSHRDVEIICEHCHKTFTKDILEDSTFRHCPGCGNRILTYRAPKEWMEERLSSSGINT